MAAFTLRPATAPDQPAIRRIVREAGINPTALNWPQFVVAVDGGAIVGVGQVKRHRDGTSELASIAVVPARRSEGIGSAIVRALLEREAGVLHLTCRRQLEGYYARFGFRRLERRDYPAYFASRVSLVNAFLRWFGVRIIVMRRP